MIRFISGEIINFEEKGVIIKQNGFGYLVFILTKEKNDLQIGQLTEFLTSFIIRENSQELYGFRFEIERKLFELLISISGIGPKTALAILELDSAQSLSQAISENNITYLTQVSGIGKKMAEKIILELKDKITNVSFEKLSNNNNYLDISEVLEKMGYQKEEIRQALKELPDNIKTDDGIRLALKAINQKTL